MEPRTEDAAETVKTAAILLFLTALCGCAFTPSGKIRAGRNTVAQRGAAAVPAQASTETTAASIPLPAGTVIKTAPAAVPGALTPPAGLSITLPEPAVLSVETTKETATAPQAFTPPAPPTPSQAAEGRATWVYRLALVAGIALAAFGLVRDYTLVMTGGAAVALASAAGLFIQAHPLLFGLIGAGTAAAAAGVWIWHTKLKKQPAAT